MRTLCSLILAAALFGLSSAEGLAQGASAKTGAPGTEEEKTLYTLGTLLSRNIAVFHLTPAEMKFVTMGLAHSVEGKKPQVDADAYGPKVNQLAQKRQAELAEKEKAKSKAFLDMAAKEKGATAMPSGLVYKELKPGKGASPKETDTVKVHYRGTLTDGTEFDSSFKRNAPAEFPLNGVIPCWTEGVQKLKVGGKSQLVCPSAIGYGDRGSPPTIPGGATLVFEVELLEIVKK